MAAYGFITDFWENVSQYAVSLVRKEQHLGYSKIEFSDTLGDLPINEILTGFAFEDIEWLKEYVESIDSSQISFKLSGKDLDKEKIKII